MKTLGDNRWDPIWVNSFCTKDEIERISNPKTPKDFLLRKRADIVADNMRYQRVYMNKSRMNPEWSFENSFVDEHYQRVLNSFLEKDKIFCNEIIFGDMFSNDVNGYAWKDDNIGRIISLNESLQFYMKFCNLALFPFKEDIPIHVRKNSLRIAMRVMLKQEAMDFFMDPRGIIPLDIFTKIHQPIQYELQYIAGHEFSHHLCGHLDDKDITSKKILGIPGNNYFEPVYNVNQQQEFEADIDSIKRPQYNEIEFSNILEGALIWFISLDLSETVQEIINPQSSFAIKTHPAAMERYNYILKNIQIPKQFSMEKINIIKENAKIFSEFLVEDISVNFEAYETYGSCYLDSPNTEWRGKELIDRVDYY